jgi:hypothetical protein
VFEFLKDLATNSSETTDVERKIIQLKIKKRKLMEIIKKIKQEM